jgi:hypothetical protein
MDDHDLGALLDATAPAAVPSDETLARIHGRAAQRRRRTALARGALTLVLVAALALGISALGAANSDSSLRPANADCSASDVIVRINGVPDVSKGSSPGLSRWAVVAISIAATKCRLVTPITATIRDLAGKELTNVDGTRDAKFDPKKARYRIELDPHSPTFVAHLNWLNPCSEGSVVLEVAKPSEPPARLHIPEQPCRSGASRFFVDGPGPIAGTDCPKGSIALVIHPEPVRTGDTFRWTVTGTAHTTFPCRTHGLDAAIESLDGAVLTGVPGNPAVQNDQFQDMLSPEQPVFVDYLQWSKPCSTGPVVLVVEYHDGMSAPGARLLLRQPRCVDGIAGHFQITGRSSNP